MSVNPTIPPSTAHIPIAPPAANQVQERAAPKMVLAKTPSCVLDTGNTFSRSATRSGNSASTPQSLSTPRTGGCAVRRPQAQSGEVSIGPLRLTKGPGASIEDLKNLKEAARWVAAKYPELLPASARRVVVETISSANNGEASPLTGNVRIAAGSSVSKMVDAVAHELLHSHPESVAGRAMQNVQENILGNDSEHTFVHKLGQAVRAHYDAEQRAGGSLTRAQAWDGGVMNQMVITGSDGAPALHNHQETKAQGKTPVEELPGWSSIRASYRKEK